MNTKKHNRCLKKKRKKTVRQWKAIRNRRRKAVGKKFRRSLLVMIVLCTGTGTASAKDGMTAKNRAELRLEKLPAFIEIRSFCEKELPREGKNTGRTEQGISLFLKEGRVVFFRIHEEPCSH